MLNGKEMIEKGIITGIVPTENIQMHSVDLNLIDVKQLQIPAGLIPKEGKTQLCKRETISLTEEDGKKIWHLPEGSYDITFEQGCIIPNDQMLLIRQRSSLLRNGALIVSSIFDSGFQTVQIGTIMIITVPICIEYGARIASIYNHACTPVETLYNGQWQEDRQRNN